MPFLAVTAAAAPLSPVGLGASDLWGEGGSLSLSWTANTEVDLKDYGVYRSTAAGQTASASTLRTYVAAPGTTHYEAGLVDGTTYYYQLTARNSALSESPAMGDVSAYPLASGTTNHVVISEIAIAGNVASDEFVELYNPTTASISMSGWRLTRKTATGGTTQNMIAAFPSTWTIVSKGYFLLTSNTYSKPGGMLADSEYGAGTLAVNNTVILYSDAAVTKVDLVGMGNVTNVVDGYETQTTTSPLTAQSVERKPGVADAAAGNGTDTNNNNNDFDVRTTSQPQDAASTLEPDLVPPATPSGLGVADPGTTELNLSWTANTETDLKDYRLYRSTNGNPTAGSSWTVTLAGIASPGTTHQDASLTAGTFYAYRISARDAALNESGRSAQVSSVPGAPAAPAGPAATAGDALADLNWTANTEADIKDYRVYRSTNGNVTAGSTWTITLATILSPGTTHRDPGLTNLATYYYKLDARDTSLNGSALSVEVSTWPRGAADTMPPTAPSGLTLGDPGSTALNLNWTANTEGDLKDYRIHRSTNAGVVIGGTQTVVLAAVAAPGTTHQDTGLTAATRYNFKLTARDTSLNESAGSGEVSGVPGAPAAPTGVGIADVPGDQGFALRLSWTANTEGDLKDYRVYRSTNGNVTVGSTWTVTLATIAQAGTTHQDAGLTPVTTYYYKVTARDASLNESSGSTEVNARPQDNTAPAAPGGLAVGDPGTTVLNLNWTVNTESDVREYLVYRSTNIGVTLVSTHVVVYIVSPGTTDQDAGLTAGRRYNYKVTARDNSTNESGGSAEASGVPGAPAAPTGLGIGDPGTTVLNLSWTANTEADLKDYRVYRSTNAGVTQVSTHVVTNIASPGTTHQDANVVVGMRHAYRVSARDTASNESGLSSEVSGVPGTPGAPTGLGTADVAADQGTALNLSWTANTEADLKDYRIFRSTNGNVTVGSTWTVTLATLAQPGTTHQDAGLTPVATYYYKVTARDNATNESAASSEANLRPVDNLAPTAPGAPTVADVPADQGFALRLNWTLNTETDVREYGVYRSTNGNVTLSSSWTVLVTLVLSPGTTRQDGGLTNGTTFYYKLSARDTGGNESGLSAEASALPLDNVGPAAPTGLGTSDVPADQGFALRLSWTANTEADLKDYRIWRSTNGNVTAPSSWTVFIAFVGPGTTHQDSGLNNGATYYYKLDARDTALNLSPPSAQASSIPYDNLAPAAPTGLGVADVAGDQGFALQLSWTANTESDLKDYKVTRATSTPYFSSVIAAWVVAPGTTYQDGGLTNGSTYYYALNARDTSLNEGTGSAGLPQAFPQDNLAPAAPTGLGLVDPGATVLNLLWSANTEADLKDYVVYRSTNIGVTQVSSHSVAAVASPGTTNQNGDVVVGTRYNYRISARDISGNQSGLSAEVSGVPGTPAIPTGPGVADVAADQGTALNLSWTADTEPDLKDYGVYRSTLSGALGAKTPLTRLSAPGTTHQDTGLTPVTTYFYQITARDTGGNESAGSSEVTLRPVDNVPPVAPAAPTVADVPADQGFALRLNWTLNTETDVREYGVYRSTNGNVTLSSSWTALVTLVLSPGTTRQDSGLTNGATYYYKLSARDTGGNESGLSGQASAIPYDDTAPGTPTGVTVVVLDGGVRLYWTANTEPDLKDYRLYRSTNGNVTVGSSWTITLATLVKPGTTHQDDAAATLTNGTTYYYRLAARDVGLNESAGSTEISATPTLGADTNPPVAPTGLGLADVAGDQGVALNLSWAANTEVDLKDYRLFRSTNGNVTAGSSWTVTLAVVVKPGTTHQDAGLTPMTTYYYKITARDASLNESPLSGEVNLWPSDNLAPATPAAPTVADVPSDQGFALRLNWTLNTEADVREYRVYRSTSLGVTQVSSNVMVTVTSPGTTHQDGGLTNGTTLYYRLAARDISLNESGLSSEASAIPLDNLAPGAPTGLGVVDVPSDQGFSLRLNWTTNTESDLKDYGVYRATWAGASPAPTPTRISTPGTTHQDGGLTNGTTYYFRLTARDVSFNDSGYSAEASAYPADNLAPAAPTGLGLADPGTTVLNLSWTASTEADLKDYRIYRSTNGGVTLVSSHVVTSVAAPGTTHQDAGLTAGTRLFYRLTTRDVSLNESGGSSEISGVPGSPAAPVGLGLSNTTAGANAGNRLTLSWTANTEADLKDYGISQATWAGASPAPTPARIAAPGTTHQAAGLANGTTYYVRLTARDASLNESGYSAEASAYPADVVAPGTPVGVGVGVAGAVALNLSWTANTEPDLKDYRVYRSTLAGVTQVSSLVVTGIAAPGTTHQDGGLVQGTTYYYRISARDVSLNESGLSSEASGTTATDTTPPGNPAGLGAADVTTGGRLNVSWTANTEADLKDYRVYRSTNTGVTQVSSHVVTVVAAPGTTYQDAGLANGTTYFYKLSARDISLNESGLSSQVSAYPNDVVAPAAPAGLGVSNATGGAAVGGRLTLSWTANTEGDLKDYRLFRSTFNGALGTKSALTAVASPGTTHQDAGLTNGTTSYYQLTARDASGNESGGSAQASAYAADSTAPGIPAGLGVANPATGLRLNVSWTANSEGDLKDYGVYQATWAGASPAPTPTRIAAPGTTHQAAGLANGTTYFFRLSARDVTTNESGFSSEQSGTPTDTTAPASPAGLTTTDAPSDQGVALRLNWSANAESDLKDYRLWRGAASGGIGTKTNIAVIASPGTTHQDGGLAAGTTNYYQITARDQAGNESVGSGEISGYPQDNLAPSSPTAFGVAVVALGSRVNLSWTANTEADLKDYRAWRGLASGSIVTKSSIAAIATPGTTHQDGGLANGTTYYYQVTARDVSFNESVGSTEQSATPQDITAPAAPAGLGAAFSGVASRVTLSWTANTESDLKDYRVYRSTNLGVTIVSTQVVTTIASPGTTHQDGGLATTTYYYRLTARDVTLNESGGSGEASANTTDVTAPANPLGLGVADVPGDQGGALRVSWTANTEADLKDYRAWRGPASGGIGTKSNIAVIATPGTTHQDTGLVNGTTYYYQLTARDTSGNESAGGSAESSAYPSDNIAPSAPAGLGVAAVVSGTLRLSWTANTEGDLKDYGVYRTTYTGFVVGAAFQAARVSSPGTTHQDGGLTKGTTFYYRLSARDTGLNESGGSTEASGIPPLIATPAGLGVADPGTGPLNLSWTANTETDLKDYGVYRASFVGAGLQAGPVVRIAGSGTTHQDAGLIAGTSYFYRLTARDLSLNESGGSAEVSGQPGAPAAPTLLGAADAGSGSALNLSWAASPEMDLKDYRLYRSTSGNVTAGSSWTVVAATVAAPGTTHQDGGLASGTAYSYRLSARDIGLNESALSGLVSAIPTTPAPVVTPPTPSAPPTTSVTATVSVSAPTGGLAELKTVLEPGKSSRIDGDVVTLKSTGAVPGDIIEVRIVNTKTNATQTVSVKVDAQGNWSVPTPKLADGTYEIQVRQVDPATNLASGWSPDKPFVVVVDAVPDQTVTIPAGPNPFRPGRGASLAVGFELEEAANVTVSIHTIDGAPVKTLVDDRALSPGKYERGPAGDTAAGWDGTNESGQVVSSGIYLIKVKIGDRVFSRKILLIR